MSFFGASFSLFFFSSGFGSGSEPGGCVGRC